MCYLSSKLSSKLGLKPWFSSHPILTGFIGDGSRSMIFGYRWINGWTSNGWTFIHSIHLSGILCIYLICIYVYMYICTYVYMHICMCYLFCEKSIGKLANKPMVHRFGRDPLSDGRRRSRAGTARASKMKKKWRGRMESLSFLGGNGNLIMGNQFLISITIFWGGNQFLHLVMEDERNVNGMWKEYEWNIGDLHEFTLW